MGTEKKKKKIKQLFQGPSPLMKGNLSEALYSMSELGLWPDDANSVSVEQALLIWRIVEKMRMEEFPEDLKI